MITAFIAKKKMKEGFEVLQADAAAQSWQKTLHALQLQSKLFMRAFRRTDHDASTGCDTGFSQCIQE